MANSQTANSFPDELIIRYVKQHSCLYDPRESDYKDAERKAAVWREIASNVGLPGKFSLNLRETFAMKFSVRRRSVGHLDERRKRARCGGGRRRRPAPTLTQRPERNGLDKRMRRDAPLFSRLFPL